MLNQINLNTNNAFTSEIQNKPKTQDQTKKNNNLLSLSDGGFDSIELQKKNLIIQPQNKKTIPFWLKFIGSGIITSATVLAASFLAAKLGYIPLKTNTKGLYNSRTTEFKNGAKDAIGGVKSIMTMNSHCGEKSLGKLPSSHQGLIVIMDKKDQNGIKTLAQSKFKDNIIYGGELKLTQLKNYNELKEYMKNLATNIKKQKNYENITFASENSRSANMLNVVLEAHAENKKATTKDFVEGGIPSHNFWGNNGLESDKLDVAIWEGWCQGMEIKSSSNPKETTKDQEINTPDETPATQQTPPKEIINKPKLPKEEDEDEEEKVKTCMDKVKSFALSCVDFIKNTFINCCHRFKGDIDTSKK